MDPNFNVGFAASVVSLLVSLAAAPNKRVDAVVAVTTGAGASDADEDTQVKLEADADLPSSSSPPPRESFFLL